MSFITSLVSCWWGYLGMALIAAGLSATATHAIDNGTIQANKAQYEANQKAESDLAAKAAADNLKTLQDQLTKTTADKAVADKELSDAKLNTDALVTSLQLGTRRLSIAGSCPAGSGGVPQTAATGPAVHAATRVQLDPAAAQRIVAITADADQTAILLKQCQAYVTTVVGK